MGITTLVYVECDVCGDPSGHDEAGMPAPDPHDSAAAAIETAVEHCGWRHAAGGQLLCSGCADGAEAEVDATPDTTRAQSWEEQVTAAVGELVAPASTIIACEAYGALVHRLRQHCERTGRSPLQVLQALSERDLEFAVDGAALPAAFLAKKVSEL